VSFRLRFRQYPAVDAFHFRSCCDGDGAVSGPGCGRVGLRKRNRPRPDRNPGGSPWGRGLQMKPGRAGFSLTPSPHPFHRDRHPMGLDVKLLLVGCAGSRLLNEEKESIFTDVLATGEYSLAREPFAGTLRRPRPCKEKSLRRARPARSRKLSRAAYVRHRIGAWVLRGALSAEHWSSRASLPRHDDTVSVAPPAFSGCR
jgi:hypothetical protein